MRTSDTMPEPLISSQPVQLTPLIQILCRFNGGCAPESLHRELRKKYNENVNYLQTLTSLTNEDVAISGIGQRNFTEPRKKALITNHLKHQQMEIYPCKLTKMGADQIFALRGYLRVTIRQYFYVRHRIDLAYPQLPLICVAGGRRHQYFYPIECIDVLEQIEQSETI
uniref:PAZ domain-containing protein n=1 Tax=Meloidogyne incognita TaxID=6306 RepID=A0A914NF44_MELIC